MTCEKYIFSFLLLLGQLQLITAQSEHEKHVTHHSKQHKITLITANSFVQNSISLQPNELLIVPTFGFNYDYFFHDKWRVGLHTDVLLQQYKIESHDNKDILTRENPVALCAMLVYKPLSRFIVVGGFGQEFEKNHTLNMIRLGIGYEIPIQKHWEIGFDLEYDYKFKTYGTWMIGVGFSKIINAKK